jgi:hypothetical protein
LRHQFPVLPQNARCLVMLKFPVQAARLKTLRNYLSLVQLPVRLTIGAMHVLSLLIILSVFKGTAWPSLDFMI